MSDFYRYAYQRSVPTNEEVIDKIRNCRTALQEGINGAPLCRSEALDTADDFSARYQSCMDCHQAVSRARGLVWHADSDLKNAFSHIDGVIEACTVTLGARSDPIPPPLFFKK